MTNAEFEKIVETSDEWIVKRTGIRERRIIEKDTPLSSIAVSAAKNALTDANIKAEDLGMIIAATITPDYLTPSLSCMVQKELGAVNAGAFDLNAACTGFIYALNVAQQYIQAGIHEYVLIVAAEALSRATDFNDRKTCVLFR
jgi:3-oxoacyl-[acyl-carrier-protein] synthase-3